jgi:hypothetical protein
MLPEAVEEARIVLLEEGLSIDSGREIECIYVWLEIP